LGKEDFYRCNDTCMKFNKQFIQRLIDDDKAAQREFYHYFSAKMYGVCMRFAKDVDDANDMMQEGFIRVFTHIADFRNEGSLEGWVRRTIVNTAINFYKRKLKKGNTVSIDVVAENADKSVYIIEKLSVDELLILIRELPTGYRTVFNLNVIEGYTHKEIGKMLNISENTSKSQLSRARTALQKKIIAIKNKEQIE